MPAPSDIRVEEIAAMLRARVAEFAGDLLPQGRRDPRGRYFEAGSVDGERGQSLKLNLSGPRQGCYTDFSAREGTWEYSGDVLTLLCHLRYGGDMGKAVAFAKSYLGLDDGDPARIAQVRREAAERVKKSDEDAERQAEEMRRRAEWLWNGSVPIRGTPAEAYLRGRGIDFEKLGKIPGSLRYRPDVWCSVRRGKHPAMVACIMGLDGQLRGVHRTYLDLSAGKGGAVKVVKVPDHKGRPKSHKMSMGLYQSGCIPLWKGACGKTLRDIDPGTPVFISEGIEDGLSVAMAAPDKRVVAGVALSNIGSILLPPQAGDAVLIGQNDEAGSKAVDAFEGALTRLQERWTSERVARSARLMFPPPDFKDFNDQLTGKRKERG